MAKLFHIQIDINVLYNISYALEISLFIMKLQVPEFLIRHTFLLHACTLMLLPGNFL